LRQQKKGQELANQKLFKEAIIQKNKEKDQTQTGAAPPPHAET
jgi:hypothetical protein